MSEIRDLKYFHPTDIIGEVFLASVIDSMETEIVDLTRRINRHRKYNAEKDLHPIDYHFVVRPWTVTSMLARRSFLRHQLRELREN